jgi:hypothetical protein
MHSYLYSAVFSNERKEKLISDRRETRLDVSRSPLSAVLLFPPAIFPLSPRQHPSTPDIFLQLFQMRPSSLVE